MFVEAVHAKPFEEVVQSFVPQAQLLEFNEEPSTTEHVAGRAQVFVEAVHTKPVDEVQSLVPQAQFSELTDEPLTTEHVAY